MIHDTVVADVPQASPSESIWREPYRLLTIGLILTIVGAAFEALAVATTMPVTVKELGGLALYGWAFSAFMLTNLIGITIAGAEADRQGPARPFILGVGLFVLGLLIAGSAHSMITLIVGRAVQGFGGGFIMPIAYIAVGRGYPEQARARMLAVLSSAWVVPGLIGPAVAGFIADHIGWRWVFLGLAPLMPLAAILALPALRRLAQESDKPRDWKSAIAAVRLSVGVGLAIAGLNLSSLLITVVLIGAGAILAFPALRSLLPAGTLRAASGLPAVIATHGLLSLGFFGVDAFIPLALTTARGQTATAAGLVLTAATVCWTTGAWLQAHFTSGGKRRRLVVLGLALVASGIVGSAAVLIPAVPTQFAMLAWGVAGLGMGVGLSTTALLVMETAPSGREGSATAAMQLANILGIALGTGVGGVIIGSRGAGNMLSAGIAMQDLLMIGVIGIGVIAAMRLGNKNKEQRTEN